MIKDQMVEILRHVGQNNTAAPVNSSLDHPNFPISKIDDFVGLNKWLENDDNKNNLVSL